MKRKFAAFDIDGTIFRSGLYRELVYELVKNDVLPQNLLNSIEKLRLDWDKRAHDNAFLDYEKKLANVVDSSLPTIKVTDFEKAAKVVINNHKDRVYSYTRGLLKELKTQNFVLLTISGSQVELVELFAQYYGFDHFIGQTYKRGEVYFTGEIIKTHKAKDVFLKQMVSDHQLSFTGSIAVGDTSGDISMLSLVENPIAFNPDKLLLEHAKKCAWQIVVERKNVTYTLKADGHGHYQLV